MSDTKTVSGNIVHIQDKGAPSALSVIVNINPKQSGSGTPSPENVRQISGWESVVTSVSGKNLSEVNETEATTSVRYILNNADLPNSDYVISFELVNATYTNGSGALLDLYDANNVNFAYPTPSQLRRVGDNAQMSSLSQPISGRFYYKISAHSLKQIRLQFRSDSYGNWSGTIKNIQLEHGTEATNYSPTITPTTTPVNLGRTVYGGEAEIVGGSLTVDRAMVTINGSSIFTQRRAGTSNSLFGLDLASGQGGKAVAETSLPNVIANELPLETAYNAWRNETPLVAVTSTGNTIWFRLPSITALADAKTYLTSNPLQVCYELATPQTYTLTGQNVPLLKDCYAWADSGDISIIYETYLINGLFHKIWINGVKMFAPNDFTLERSDVYAGEITTCTGKTIADRIGWKYADMSLNWDYLPQEYLETILNLSGVFAITFENEEGVQFTEQCIRKGSTMTGTRFTDNNGNMMWKGVQFDISFINVHN